MPFRTINDLLERFLLSLEGKDADAIFDAFQNEAIETGGTMIGPRAGDNWGPVLVEVQMHGIFATGANLDEAFTNWRKLAMAEMFRRISIEAALIMVMHPGEYSIAALHSACDTLLAESGDNTHHARARALKAALPWPPFQIPA